MNWVQGNSADAGTVSSTTLLLGTASAGNNIVVVLRLGGSSATAAITDDVNAGGYVQDDLVTDVGNNDRRYLCHRTGIAAGATTLTCTVTGGPSTVRWCIEEYSSAGALVLDQKADSGNVNVSSPGGTTDSTSTGTTAVADELCIGYGKNEGASASFTAGTGYTLRHSAVKVWVEDKVVSATGSYSAAIVTTFGSGDIIDQGIATFYDAGGGGSPPDSGSTGGTGMQRPVAQGWT